MEDLIRRYFTPIYQFKWVKATVRQDTLNELDILIKMYILSINNVFGLYGNQSNNNK